MGAALPIEEFGYVGIFTCDRLDFRTLAIFLSAFLISQALV